MQCAESGRKLAALSSQLREANVALDASKRSMEITLEKHTNTLEAARKVGSDYSYMFSRDIYIRQRGNTIGGAAACTAFLSSPLIAVYVLLFSVVASKGGQL